jgi:hypothetical protein
MESPNIILLTLRLVNNRLGGQVVRRYILHTIHIPELQRVLMVQILIKLQNGILLVLKDAKCSKLAEQ